MPHPLSNDLHARVVAFVEAGHSRNEAAAHFGTSVSFAVNLMKLWRETGDVEPRPRGGFRHGKLGPHKDFILAAVAANSGPVEPFEIPDRLWAQLQKKPFGQANKTGLSWPRRGRSGGRAASRSCENIVGG